MRINLRHIGLSQCLARYREVIVVDVTSPYYARNRWILRSLILGFVVLLSIAYVSFFHRLLWRDVMDAVALSGIASQSKIPGLDYIVFMYERLILVTAFFGLVLCFSVLAFFAFDLQQRNHVIQKLLDQISSQDRAS